MINFLRKLTPEEMIFMITLFFVSVSVGCTIVNLIIKCNEEDNKKYKHYKINDVVKETKKRIDKMNRKCKK